MRQLLMNIASLLKAEISRVCWEEVRSELQALKKTTTKLRKDNADLKRRLVVFCAYHLST